MTSYRLLIETIISIIETTQGQGTVFYSSYLQYLAQCLIQRSVSVTIFEGSIYLWIHLILFSLLVIDYAPHKLSQLSNKRITRGHKEDGMRVCLLTVG